MRKFVLKQKNKAANKKKVKLPGFWALCDKTWQELTTFWRPLSGVVAVYGVLYFILVRSFSIGYTYQDIADDLTAQLGDSAGWLATNSLTVGSLFAYSNQTDAAAIVQFLLFVIATLAFIWVLRQLRTLKHIKMRDAYFEGTARIVPATIVIALLFIPFIPAAVGSAILSIVIAGSGAELLIGSGIVIALLFLTFYWLCAWLPAIYIVSLPKGTPISSILASAKLTKSHRYWMLRNITFFAILAAVMSFIIMLLFVWLLPAASVVAAYVVSFVVFAIAQTFLFTTYRGLLDES